MRKRSPWVLIAVVVVLAGAALWLGGDWLWHLFLKMHGMGGGHRAP